MSNIRKEGVTGPLSGYRILEFAANLTAPLGAMQLADQGADVVKVESPVGDLMRYSNAARKGVQGMASMYATANRNKRSIVLDIGKPGAVEVFKDIARTCDVVLQNFRPGVIERMGLGYEELKKIRPDIILVSVSGFGPVGPYAKLRAYDPVIQALSGMMSAQRDPDTGSPGIVRNALIDKLMGLVVSQAITAALLARANTGEGQHVEINMLNAAISFMWCDAMTNQTWIGDDVTVGGTMTDLRCIYETKDGHLMAVSQSDLEWSNLCNTVGRPELIQDPRFKTLPDRVRGFKDIHAELKSSFLSKTTEEWLVLLRQADTVSAPINTEDKVCEDPQVQAMGMIMELNHPHAGKYRQPRHAAYFEKTPAQFRRHAPMLGEQSDEILGEAGYDAVKIKALRQEGVVK